MSEITVEMKIAAAEAIAARIKKVSAKKIIPGVFDKTVMKAVASAVKKLSKS